MKKILFAVALAAVSAVSHGASLISFDRPAGEGVKRPKYKASKTDLNIIPSEFHSDWESQWLPIGNGRLGAMLTGGTDWEHVQFNVDSLWTGGENPDGNDKSVGDYQNFGELFIAISSESSTNGYSRVLDLGTAVHTVKYGDMVREAFASAPDDVIALRFSSKTPFDANISLAGAHGETVKPLAPGSLGFDGVLSNGLAYAARVDWKWSGGTNLVVFLRAKTSYDMAKDSFGLGEPCKQYGEPFPGDFDAMLANHIKDYASYFDRSSVEIAGDERIGRLFDFAKYLMISSSRPGTMPANLQGLWNNSNRPAWHSDYHTNINLQMNYWFVDAANVSPCFDPLAAWLEATRKGTADATRKAFKGSKGIAYRTSVNAFGGGGWNWNFAGAPWLAVMLYDHYLYTQDREYLAKTVWPYLSDVADFVLPRLVEGPEGELLVKDGWSPEHGPREAGVMHDQQIVREMLLAMRDAAKILGEDEKLAEISSVLARLGSDKIGSWGQLQEWQKDVDDPKDDHRHTSHLFAVYPGTTISPSATPEFAKAAKVSLVARGTSGDSRRSWTWPWRAAIWARLGDGDKALEMIDGLCKYNLLPNCFATHPPFQIDGNFGVAAAICEMLVQSHERTSDGRTLVRILPALPKAWPDGKVKGIRIRGGGEIDIEWRDGKLVGYSIRGRDTSTLEIVLPVTVSAQGETPLAR